jgi:chromosome segregation ATPase
MAAKGVYDTVTQAIQDLIAPDLERIKGQLTGLDARINSLEKRVDEGLGALRSETHAGLRAVNDRIDALKERVEQTNRRLDDTNKRLDEALDIRERLAALEARMVARG